MGSFSEQFAASIIFMLPNLRSFSGQMETITRGVDNFVICKRQNMLILHGVGEKKNDDIVVAEVVKQQSQVW